MTRSQSSSSMPQRSPAKVSLPPPTFFANLSTVPTFLSRTKTTDASSDAALFSVQWRKNRNMCTTSRRMISSVTAACILERTAASISPASTGR